MVVRDGGAPQGAHHAARVAAGEVEEPERAGELGQDAVQHRVDLAVEHVVVVHELGVGLPVPRELLLGRRVENGLGGLVLPDVDHGPCPPPVACRWSLRAPQGRMGLLCSPNALQQDARRGDWRHL